MNIRDWTQKLTMLVGNCIWDQRNGYDVLASHAWDRVLDHWAQIENGKDIMTEDDVRSRLDAGVPLCEIEEEADLKEYKEQIERLQIIDRLLKTADGIPVVPGQTVYGIDEDLNITPIRVSPDCWLTDIADEDEEPEENDYYRGNVRACYSSREALERAMKKAKEE